ncbi:MAG: DUF3800 domain-containing protein [Pelotomaculum sp.]
MDHWWLSPAIIENWSENIDYILFVDENNHAKQIKLAIKLVAERKSMSIDDRYFTVTGCSISRENFPEIRRKIIELKNNYWKDGFFLYKKGNRMKRVCFHSSEIRNRRSAFSPSEIDYESFIEDLSKFLRGSKYMVFSATVDLEGLASKYTQPAHPYQLAIDFIFERYGKYFLGRRGKTGAIVFEARGPKEDRNLLKHCIHILNHGTMYCTKEDLKSIKGIYFNPKWSCDEKTTYFGLEIADLTSYPIYKFCKTGTKDRAFQSIENKFYRYPDYKGSGLKIFP